MWARMWGKIEPQPLTVNRLISQHLWAQMLWKWKIFPTKFSGKSANVVKNVVKIGKFSRPIFREVRKCCEKCCENWKIFQANFPESAQMLWKMLWKLEIFRLIFHKMWGKVRKCCESYLEWHHKKLIKIDDTTERLP